MAALGKCCTLKTRAWESVSYSSCLLTFLHLPSLWDCNALVDSHLGLEPLYAAENNAPMLDSYSSCLLCGCWAPTPHVSSANFLTAIPRSLLQVSQLCLLFNTLAGRSSSPWSPHQEMTLAEWPSSHTVRMLMKRKWNPFLRSQAESCWAGLTTPQSICTKAQEVTKSRLIWVSHIKPSWLWMSACPCSNGILTSLSMLPSHCQEQVGNFWTPIPGVRSWWTLCQSCEFFAWIGTHLWKFTIVVHVATVNPWCISIGDLGVVQGKDEMAQILENVIFKRQLVFSQKIWHFKATFNFSKRKI